MRHDDLNDAAGVDGLNGVEDQIEQRLAQQCSSASIESGSPLISTCNPFLLDIVSRTRGRLR